MPKTIECDIEAFEAQALAWLNKHRARGNRPHALWHSNELAKGRLLLNQDCPLCAHVQGLITGVGWGFQARGATDQQVLAEHMCDEQCAEFGCLGSSLAAMSKILLVFKGNKPGGNNGQGN